MTRTLLGILFLLFMGVKVSGQLKIGTDPSSVNKSAILELESDKQGLLLPRLSDTTAINGLNPPDGMMVYYLPTKTVLFRSNGRWRVIPGVFILGTNGRTPINNINLSFREDTLELNIPDANDSVRGVVSVLDQRFNGHKTFLSGIESNQAFVSGTGGAASGISHLRLGLTSASPTTSKVTNNLLSLNNTGNLIWVPASEMQVNSDWNAIAGPATILNKPSLLNSVSFSSLGLGLSGTISGTVLTLNIPDATVGSRGLMSSGSQIFTGNKTFNNAVNINGSFWVASGATVDNGLTVAGTKATGISNLKLGFNNASGVALGPQNKYLTVNSNSDVVLADAPVAVNSVIVNPVAYIGQDGKGISATVSGSTLSLHLHSADMSNAGIVTTLPQSFSGAKRFYDLTTLEGKAVIQGGSGSVSGLQLQSVTGSAPSSNSYLSLDGSGNVIRALAGVTTTHSSPVTLKPVSVEARTAFAPVAPDPTGVHRAGATLQYVSFQNNVKYGANSTASIATTRLLPDGVRIDFVLFEVNNTSCNCSVVHWKVSNNSGANFTWAAGEKFNIMIFDVN